MDDGFVQRADEALSRLRAVAQTSELVRASVRVDTLSILDGIL